MPPPAAGRSCCVSGGAGIGKTSVVRAFARAAAGRARVLLSACDDLMAPRALGPLRDAALESGGPLEAAFAEGRPVDGVYTAVLAELAAAPPTALVVEDVHWADDATLDVLGYVARRIEPVPAVLVLTFRDDELGPSHPLQRLLGALAGRPVLRLALPPLSRSAVRQLAASTGADAGAVHRVTGGNPFFVTEVLASPADVVPATVVEAVLARVAPPGPGLPRGARAALGRAVADPVRARRRAARRPHRRARGGRARRGARGLRAPPGLPPRAGAAGDRAQPAGARAAAPERTRPGGAPAAGAARAGEPDALRRRGGRRRHRARGRTRGGARGGPGRVAPAGARAPRVGPPAPVPARRARAGGRARRLRLGALQRASLPRGGRRRAGGGRAVRAAGRPGRRRPLPRARVAPPVHGGRDGRGRGVREPGRDDPRADGRQRRARVGVAAPRRDPRADRRARAGGRHARARPRPRRSAPTAATSRRWRSTTSASRPSSAATPAACGWCATASRPRLGEAHHEVAARGYCNVAELLYREGRLAELEACIAEGLPFVRERGFWSHAYNLELHRCVLQLRRGDLDGALAGLRELVHGVEDPGMLFAYSVPWLGRALARRGDPAAGGLLAAAWDGAQRQRLLLGVAYAGLASVEWAWLTGRPGDRRARRRRARAAAGPPRRRAVPSRAGALSGARRPPRRAVRRLPGAVGGGPARRLAGGRRRLGGRRATRTSRRSS